MGTMTERHQGTGMHRGVRAMAVIAAALSGLTAQAQPATSGQTAEGAQKFLATLPLSGASLPEANREDRARLAAAGMNTAADVLAKRNELHHVVSYAVVRDLLNWAENRSAEFMLDPAAPMPADPDWAARDLEAVVEDLMGRLASGAELLEERKQQIHASLDALNRRAAKRMIAREMP